MELSDIDSRMAAAGKSKAVNTAMAEVIKHQDERLAEKNLVADELANKLGNETNKVKASRLLVVAQQTASNATRLQNISLGLDSLRKLMEDMHTSVDGCNTRILDNAKVIEENKSNLTTISDKVAKLEEGQEENSSSMNRCLERIECLEKSQLFFQKVEDQDAKIASMHNKISPQELTRGSCVISFHGLPLPKSLSSMDTNNPKDTETIAKAFMEGLKKETTEFIFAVDEEGSLLNMHSWAKLPTDDGYRFPRNVPEVAHNSVIFFFKSRAQALRFEIKVRGALIATQMQRRESDFGHMELGIYAESPRVRALHRFLLYKGKMLTENFDQFSSYRVAWRGGAGRNASHEPPRLSLEIKASKSYAEITRRDYFFNGEKLTRNLWTEHSNIKISNVDDTWFPKKFDETTKVAPLLPEGVLEASAMVLSPKERLKRARESPGLAGNASKQSNKDVQCPHMGCEEAFRSSQFLAMHKAEAHGHPISEEEDESSDDEDKIKKAETKKAETKKAEETLTIDDDADNDKDFSPASTKKERKREKNRLKALEKAGVAKPGPLPEKGGLQKKITSFTKKSEPNTLPVPKLIF